MNTLGVLASPNHPGYYPPSLEKKQTLQVEEGLILILQFTAFDIEECSNPTDGNCVCDHLTIVDGDGTTLMEKNCGMTLPVAIRSKTNMVDILFSTDGRSGSDTQTGWRMTWNAVPPGGELYLNCLSIRCGLTRLTPLLLNCFFHFRCWHLEAMG